MSLHIPPFLRKTVSSMSFAVATRDPAKRAPTEVDAPAHRSPEFQCHRTQAPPLHRAHLRAWRLVVLATQTPLILTHPRRMPHVLA